MAGNLKWITESENSKSNIEKYPENRLKLKQANEENGYYKKLKHYIWKKPNLKKVKKMENWGVSQKEIARIYECSISTVYNVIKKLKS
jgi:DNA invertase Pin-like site-specific DNA recombinase